MEVYGICAVWLLINILDLLSLKKKLKLNGFVQGVNSMKLQKIH